MRTAAYALIIALALVVGCNTASQSPIAPSQDQLGLPSADSTRAGIRHPDDQISATPPSFPDWNVVSGSSTVIFGPIWDQDWKITFYLPNRSSLPATRNVAARNIWGTWYLYDRYVLLYEHGRAGTSYRVTYVFGGNRANLFGINMFDPTNWALYYR